MSEATSKAQTAMAHYLDAKELEKKFGVYWSHGYLMAHRSTRTLGYMDMRSPTWTYWFRWDDMTSFDTGTDDLNAAKSAVVAVGLLEGRIKRRD